MMLLKPTGAVPHVGGALIQPGEPYYEIIRSLDRRRRQARPDHAARDQDRGLPGQPGRPADRLEAAAPRAGDLRRAARSAT